MIAVLAGRRIDKRNTKEARFPLEMKDTVYKKIRDLFSKDNVSILVSSAACGADLLAHQAARELKIEQHIILPFGREKFRRTSVTDRPGNWGKLFDEICDEVSSKDNLIVLEGFENDKESAYAAVTTELIRYAKNLQSNKEKLLAVAVGKGKPKDESDETVAFVRLAKSENITVKEILTN